LQVPEEWQPSDAVQFFGAPALQAPPWQVSASVQPLPSLQDVPFAATGFEQTPVAGLHVPAVWHWSEAVQVFGLPPVQAPA
jgi:hypothetical protein